MCLAVPSKVVSIDDDFITAEVDVMGNTKKIGIMLTPNAHIGSWVLVHAGQAISIVSEEEAMLSLEMWEEIINSENQ